MSASITCPICSMTSHHPKDVEHGYCGHCHAFTSASCEMTPERVLDHSSDGRCPLCLHPAANHPRQRDRPQPTHAAIWERVKP